MTVSSFTLFWCSRVASNLANQMVAVAIGWQIYELTGSAAALGAIGLVQFIPTLALVLVVGHVADRYERRAVAAMGMAVEGLMTVAVAIAVALHALSPAWLFVATGILGLGRAFEAPTIASLLPNLVPRDRLTTATAQMTTANRVAVIAGPAIGGALFAVGPLWVYALGTAFFALSALLILLTRPAPQTIERAAPTLASLFGGVTFVLRSPIILGAISLDLFAVIFGGATALLPIYARDILAIGPWGLGLLRSAPAVGSLAMTLYLTRFPVERNVGRAMFASVAAFGVATVVFAYSRSFVLSFVALALAGLVDVISVLIRYALMQTATPDEMRGRVNAVNSLFTNSSNQLGMVESGLVAEWLGAVPSAALGGFGTIVVALLWVRVFPRLARVDTYEEVAPPAVAQRSG